MVKSGEVTILKIDDLTSLQSLKIEVNQNKLIQFQSSQDILHQINLQITQHSNSSLKLVCVFNHSIDLSLNLTISGNNTRSQIYNLVDLKADKEVALNQSICTESRNNQVEHISKIVLDQDSCADIKHLAKAKTTTKNLQLNQKLQSLLLSPKARVKMQPILQIESEDVQCKHGSTQGFLDMKVIYYLQSRGLNIDTSKQLLVRVFKSEILSLLE